MNENVRSSSVIAVIASTTIPPRTPSAQVDAPRVATPFLGITLASPQKVIGPPAAAVNSSAAAGAVPIPARSIAATSGISNINGTFIAIPSEAATIIPKMSSPIQAVTVSGLTHWIASPLMKPAITMIGPSRSVCLNVALTNCRNAVLSESFQETPSGKSDIATWSSGSLSWPLLPTTHATSGPSMSAPSMLRATRLPPMIGMKTRTAMVMAGRFIVDEPCVIATVVSMPAPRRRKAVAIGTMHAEHRFTAGPIITPLSTPLNPSSRETFPDVLREEKRLCQAGHDERECHPHPDKAQVGQGEIPPPREQGPIVILGYTESLEAFGLRGGRYGEVGRYGVELGYSIERQEQGEKHNRYEDANETPFLQVRIEPEERLHSIQPQRGAYHTAHLAGTRSVRAPSCLTLVQCRGIIGGCLNLVGRRVTPILAFPHQGGRDFGTLGQRLLIWDRFASSACLDAEQINVPHYHRAGDVQRSPTSGDQYAVEAFDIGGGVSDPRPQHVGDNRELAEQRVVNLHG